MTAGWWAAALVALAAPAAAPTPSLTAWHGTWVGEGTAFGQPASATLGIGSAEGGATALAYRLSIEGTPSVAYSAEAIYRIDNKGRLSGNWTDNHGRTRPIGGRVSGHLWVSNWGSADVEIGRSTYRLDGPNSLIVSDSVLQDDGRWRVFSMLRYRRSKG